MPSANKLAIALWRPPQNGSAADPHSQLSALPRTEMQDGPEPALRLAAGQFPGHDVLLLQSDRPLPPGFLARMQVAWQQYENIEVLSPLNKEASFSIAASSSTEIDELQFLQAEHSVKPSLHWASHGSLWRSPILAEVFSGKKKTIDQLQYSVLHGVYVADEYSQADTAQEFIGDGKPVLLHVLHSWGGGVEYFARDLSAGDGQRHHLLLRANSLDSLPPYGKQLALYQSNATIPLQTWRLESPVDDTSIKSPEIRKILQEIIGRWGVGSVIVSSLIGHSLDVVETGLPTTIVCHDAYPYWPVLHDRREPDAADFSAGYLQKLLDSDSDATAFTRHPAAYWTAIKNHLVETVLNRQITCVVPGAYAKRRLCKIEPRLDAAKWKIIPHGSIALRRVSTDGSRFEENNKLRVLVPGHVNGEKGETLLLELLPMLPAGIELVLLGCAAYLQPKFQHPAVTCFPEYRREDLSEWVEKIKPDLALLPSLVPETFGYVLSEMLAVGLPVLCANIGAYAQRAESEASVVAVEANADAFLEKMQYFQARKTELARLASSVPGQLPDLKQMAAAWAEAFPTKPPRWFFNYSASQEVQEESHMNMKLDQLIETLAETQNLHLQQQRSSAEKVDSLLKAQEQLNARLEKMQADFLERENRLKAEFERRQQDSRDEYARRENDLKQEQKQEVARQQSILADAMQRESDLQAELLRQQKSYADEIAQLHQLHANQAETATQAILDTHKKQEYDRQAWERKLRQLESSHAKVANELRDVYASRSWKITAVFRGIKTWFIK